MENKDEAKPSPYVETLATPSTEDKAFVEQITEVCNQHGYGHFFIAFTRSHSHESNAKNWKGFSGGLSEDMVVYLELISKAMRLTWDNIRGKK